MCDVQHSLQQITLNELKGKKIIIIVVAVCMSRCTSVLLTLKQNGLWINNYLKHDRFEQYCFSFH